jgi:hypothetical protein
MSKINHRRKEWKIKIRKPVSIRPSKVMGATKYERHHVRQELHELLKEVPSDSSKEHTNDKV